MINYKSEKIEVSSTSTWKVTLHHLINEVLSQDLWDIDVTNIIYEDDCEDFKKITDNTH